MRKRRRSVTRCGSTRRRGVEGTRRGRLPVDDDLLPVVVVHPAAADVQRPFDILEVEPAEEEAPLRILEGREPPGAPRLEGEGRDLLVGGRRRPADDLTHPLETGVRVVDVALLGFELGMRHRASVAAAVAAAYSFEQARLRRGRHTDVRASELRDHTPARGALEEAELEQVRLVDVLDRVGLLAERDGERGEADRATFELVRDRPEQLAVRALETLGVDLEQVERLCGDLARDRAVVANLRDVADAAQDPVRDPRCPARPARDLGGRVVLDLDAEDAGGAPHDRRELILVVVAEPEGHPEAVAQRCRQKTGARRRPDESEGRQVERERPRGRSLADDDVEPEVLQRGIEDLLDRPVDAVDLVDEEHVPGLERRQDRRHVALALERGAGDRADADVELLADDLRERRLAEPGRADEKDVVEGLVAGLRRGQGDRELLLDALLADEVGEAARAERGLERPVLLEDGAEQSARHAATRSARRTRSSAGSSGSTCASTSSASITEYPSSTRASRAVKDSPARRLGGRRVACLALQLEHDPLRGLLADAGDRLEPRDVLERDRPSEVGRRTTPTRPRARPSARRRSR